MAGDATSRSSGSKIRFILLLIWIISPLIRQSFLLSSSTVFMFSIQMASTGPSNISHLRFSSMAGKELRVVSLSNSGIVLQVPSQLQAESKETTDLSRCERLLSQPVGHSHLKSIAQQKSHCYNSNLYWHKCALHALKA